MKRFFILALFSAAAGAAEPVSRCQLKRNELGPHATAMLKHSKQMGESFQGLRTIQNHLRVIGNQSGAEKDVLFEGFIRPGRDYYRLVPGLGLGVNVGDNTLLYVCIDLRPNYGDSRITVNFLKAMGMDRGGLRGKLLAYARRTSSNLQIRPLNEGVLLLQELPILSSADPSYLERGVDDAQANIYRAVNVIGGVGAQEIVISPKQVVVKLGAEILTIPVTPLVGHKIKYDSEWMNSNYDPTKDPESSEPSEHARMVPKRN
jgi:hypothetical protein